MHWGLVDSKLAILGCKNIHLKKSKILHLSKGVSPWFLAKNWNSFFFSTEKGHTKVFSDLLDRKLAISCYKNIDLKKSKVLHFFKVVSWWFLVKKWKFCPFFLFQQNRPNLKVFSDLVDRKQAMLDYINIDLKKSKIFIFPKGLVHGFRSKIGSFVPACFSTK